MELIAINADITTLEVDAIVNAANSALAVGGGVDGAIHKAAGPDLLAFNQSNYPLGCPTGMVKMSPGFDLPAKYVLHTVGPDMRLYVQEIGDELLAFCYLECMQIAIKEGFKSIAFPAISTGVYGFNKHSAAEIAISVMDNLDPNGAMDIKVIFACFGEEDTAIVQAEIDRT